MGKFLSPFSQVTSITAHGFLGPTNLFVNFAGPQDFLRPPRSGTTVTSINAQLILGSTKIMGFGASQDLLCITLAGLA